MIGPETDSLPAMVGTHTCAARPKKVQCKKQEKLMGERVASKNARERSQMQKKSVETCNAGRAGAHPYRRRA
jgi:hypothetical protein